MTTITKHKFLVRVQPDFLLLSNLLPRCELQNPFPYNWNQSKSDWAYFNKPGNPECGASGGEKCKTRTGAQQTLGQEFPLSPPKAGKLSVIT